MHPTLAGVIEKYRTLRERVYRSTEQNFANLRIRARPITEANAAEADVWPDKHGVRTWSWQQWLPAFRKDPKRFDLAIYVGETLCAVCLGQPSVGKMALKLYIVQGKPYDNPIEGNILNVVFYAAHSYAKALGSLEVHICEPANDRLIAIYAKHGYQASENKEGVVTQMKKPT